MSKCTAAAAVSAMLYYVGYLEKASSQYASSRDKLCFEKNPGSNNYTYAGYVCGVQGQPWCAAQVSTAILDACGNKADAKSVMWGVWPYVACNQLYDAAPSSHKGRRGAWTPKPGDVIIFSSNGSTREHTGMVYAVEGSYVYTVEGNSSNSCRKRSYLITSSYIWGYVRPDYKTGSDPDLPVEQYGKVVLSDTGLHLLSKGCAGPEVKTVQRILYARGIRDDSGAEIKVDGDFGKSTEQAVKKLQKMLDIYPDGWVGEKTWKAMLTQLK